MMQEISAQELAQKMAGQEDIRLVDVREPWEHEIFHIGGDLIPLDKIAGSIDLIDTTRPVIFYCRKGIRSQLAIQRLQQKGNFTNLFNLTGGMDAWQKEYPSG